MGRPDKREKQLKRARAEIDIALSRGRLAEAADALLALPAGERERGAASLAAQLADEQERLLRAREVAPLLAWCTRCEREPRLLPGPDAVARMRWCWLVAAIRAGNWRRARAICTELEPDLAGWSSFPALSALVTHEGRLEPSALQALASESQRLGYEVPPKRTSYPCPARVEDVEAACVTCFALEPWPRFRSVVNEWLGRAPGELAREICGVAVALSRRELVLRAASDPGGALEAARCCALWCLHAERPLAMEPSLMLCVRIAAQALVGTVTDPRVVGACTPIVAASLGYASLVEPVAHVALAPLYALELADAAVQLLRPLVERAPGPRPILKLSAILAMQAEQSDKPLVAPPPWLAQSFERALRQPDVLAAAIAEPAARTATLYLLDVLPLELCVRACVALFPAADERARELLASAAEDAVLRMRKQPVSGPAPLGLSALRAMLESVDPDFARQLSDADFQRFLATPQGKELQRHLRQHGSFELAEAVPEALRSQLEQLAAPLLPYSAGLLDEMLAFCRNSSEERALATRFWSRRPSLTARFGVLVAANQAQYDRALGVLERELLRDYQPDVEDAARALSSAERVGAPRPLRKKIAEALLRALAENPAQADHPQVAESLRVAQRLVKPRASRPAGPGKRKRAPEEPKPKASARSKKAPAKRQVELFGKEGNAP